MNSNETLTAPSPTAIDTQVTVMSEEAEAEYTYQRADGTVERAHSPEDAINRCPVLGKWAIESSDQVDIFLKLAAAGKQKMQAQQEQPEHKVEEKVHVEPKQEPQPEAAKEDEHIKAGHQQHFEPADGSDVQYSGQTEQQTEVRVAEQSESKVDTPVVDTPATSAAAETYNDVTVVHKEEVDVSVDDQGDGPAIEKPLVVAEARMSELLKREEVIPVTEEAEYKMPAVTEKDEQLPVEPTTSEPTEAIQTVSKVPDTLQDEPLEVSDEEVEPVAQHDEIDKLPLPLVTEEETAADTLLQEVASSMAEEQQEVQFEPETIETYNELMELTTAHEAEVPTLENSVEATEIMPEELAPAEAQTEEKSGMTVDLATFIAEQPETEEPITLETIVEQADEQPLEQTLAQVIELLSSTPSEQPEILAEAGADEQPDDEVALRTLLQDIATALPACYVMSEKQEQKIQLTPEMTGKLLLLLRQLGYEHPREVLIEFVRKHGLAFLFQTLQNMCLLNNEEDKQESRVSSTTYASSDNGTVRLRLGKVLFGLVARQLSLAV